MYSAILAIYSSTLPPPLHGSHPYLLQTPSPPPSPADPATRRHMAETKITLTISEGELQRSIRYGRALSPELYANVASLGNLDLVKCLRRHGCPWDDQTCSRAAQRATCTWSNGPGPTGARGTATRAAGPLGEGTWASSSGLASRAALGEASPVASPLEMGTWM